MKNDRSSRRNMMKRSAAFVLPTIFTFQIASLKVQASGSHSGNNGNHYGNNGNHYGNNGNHYGNNKGDNNPKDVNNKHNTAF